MSVVPASRRTFLAAATAVGLAALAAPMRMLAVGAAVDPDLSTEQLAKGLDFIRRYPSVDLHAHPGRFFLEEVVDASPTMRAFGTPFTDRSVSDLRAGHVSAALFSGVSDARLLGAQPSGALYATREFEPGEAWQDYRRQIGVLRRLLAQRKVGRGTRPSDIAAAKRHDTTACIFSIEGGDFIEDRLERVHQAHADGVRAVTIVHYHNNQIGDIQTQPLTHGGLSATGRRIVKEMNRTGIIVDLAHASPRVVRDALDVATRPAIASHTNLNRADFEHPRLISAETARLIVAGGGVIGSVPSGIGQASFGGWIDAILRLVDVVGADHVGIGTDMDANYAPVFTDYRLWHRIPAALLARGMTEAEVAGIMAGNFERVFRAVSV